MITDQLSIEWLKDFYGVQTGQELRRAAYNDWRACLPVNIADENGVIPRTPRIQMENDPNWFRLDELAVNLRTLVNGE